MSNDGSMDSANARTVAMTREQAVRAANGRDDVVLMDWEYDEHHPWGPDRIQAAVHRLINLTMSLTPSELERAITSTDELRWFREKHPKLVGMLVRRDVLTNPHHMQILSHVLSAYSMHTSGAISEEQAKGAIADYAIQNLKEQADRRGNCATPGE